MQDSYAILAILKLQENFPKARKADEDEFYAQHADNGWIRLLRWVGGLRHGREGSVDTAKPANALPATDGTMHKTRCDAPGLVACH